MKLIHLALVATMGAGLLLQRKDLAGANVHYFPEVIFKDEDPKPMRDNAFWAPFLDAIALLPFEDIQALSARSRAACEEMTFESKPIRLLRSLFLPEDGSCFLLFEAASVAAVVEAAQRALVPAGPVWELRRS